MVVFSLIQGCSKLFKMFKKVGKSISFASKYFKSLTCRVEPCVNQFVCLLPTFRVKLNGIRWQVCSQCLSGT